MAKITWNWIGVLIFVFVIRHCNASQDILVPIGNSCTKDEDCDFWPEKTECDDFINFCVCNAHHVPHRENSTGPVSCEPISNELGSECVTIEQCTRGVPGYLSDCLPSPEDSSVHICMCIAEAINEPGDHECHPIRDFVSQPCEVNAQCKVNLGELSECRNRQTCECLDEAVASIPNDFCLPIINELEMECMESQQCQAGTPGDHSTCAISSNLSYNSICTCMNYAISPAGQHKCYVKANATNDPCEINEQCTANLGLLSKCVDNVCKCVDNEGLPRSNQTECYPIRNQIGDQCWVSEQCTGGSLTNYSACINNTCQCSEEGVAEPGEHVCRRKSTHVGDHCFRNEQCKANLGPLSECLAGSKCRCIPNYALTSSAIDKCLPITHYIGGPCEEPQQCQMGLPGSLSTCTENQCVCQNGAVREPCQNTCYKVAERIDDQCQVDIQCQASLGELTRCLPSGNVMTCQCVDGVSLKDSNANKCLPIANELKEIEKQR